MYQELDEGERLWREDAFLHQLSRNGSLLLLENSDERYQRFLAGLIGLTPGVDWNFQRSLLRALPASIVRRALWRASVLWWLSSETDRRSRSHKALAAGALTLLSENYLWKAEASSLERTEVLLEKLAWCGQDTGDEDPIAVIDTLT